MAKLEDDKQFAPDPRKINGLMLPPRTPAQVVDLLFEESLYNYNGGFNESGLKFAQHILSQITAEQKDKIICVLLETLDERLRQKNT